MQEFIFCVIPFVFKISHTAELPLSMNILHSLLEDFLSHYYYSKVYSGLFKFLGHARQFRNSAVKLTPSVIFKKSLVTLNSKGLGFKLESSEVLFIFCAFCFFSLSKCNNFLILLCADPIFGSRGVRILSYLLRLSNNIFQSFRQFLFEKFAVPSDSQL